MNRTEKNAVVDGIRNRVSGSASMYLTDFTGLSVKSMTDFRRKLRDAGGEYVVVKNTLATRAFRETEVEALLESLKGPTGIVFAAEDPVGPAKVIREFQKEHEKPEVRAGFLDGRVVTAAEIERLASLPSQEELLGQLAGSLQSPLQAFLGVTNGLLNQFVGVLEALKAQRSDAA